jgi:arabinogalactan oligomer/maltooligosaccharide transport system permease protein
MKGIKRFFYRSRGDSPFKRVLIHLVLIIACAIAIYPALRILSVSLRPGNRLLSTDLSIIPKDATFENFKRLFTEKDFLLWVWNSLIITITTATIGVIIASASAYAFSRWKFPGRNAGMVFLLSTQMIPAAMMMVPIYIIAAKLQLINTYRGLALAYSVTSVPFSVWILKGYYDTIPRELEEAAMIDGMSQMGTFYRIILPLAAPALAIAFLFNFMNAWNDYMLARIMLQKREMLTWTLGLFRLQDQFQTEWGMYAAASLLIILPVGGLFFYSSKWLVSGLTLGSVKG